MKRLLIVLAALFAFIPCVAKADMGGPIIQSYEVTPIDVNGAAYYDYDYDTEKFVKKGTIDYGKKVKVSYESFIDGILVGDIDINDDSYIIKLSDYITVKESYLPNTKDNYTTTTDEELTVLAKDGIKLHKGPSYAYKTENIVIPFNTVIKATYGHGEESDVWYYVEYSGLKGWVCILDGKIGIKVDNSKNPLILAKDAKIYDSVGEDRKVIGIAPAHEKFYSYYNIDDWSWGYYLTYGGISGYIDYDDTLVYFYDDDEDMYNNIVLYDHPVYASADSKSKQLITLKKCTEFKIIGGVGHYTYWYYINVDGVKGYIDLSGEDDYYLSEDEDYYDDLVSGKMTVDEYESLQEDEDEPTIDEEEEDPFLEEDENQEPEEEDKEVVPGVGSDNKTTSTKDESSSKDKGVNLSTTDIVLICVISALAVALTSIVTIVLVNKKKATKVNNVVETQPVAQEVQPVAPVEEVVPPVAVEENMVVENTEAVNTDVNTVEQPTEVKVEETTENKEIS